MMTDQDITLGYVNTDDAIQSSPTVEVTAVATTLEINPQMIMWDPEQLDADPTDPATIGETGARVLHFGEATYIDWMIANGYLDESQSDPNYGGSPDQWITDGGDFIQQGFATNEIYKYENEIEWKDGAPAPVEYAIIHELGWQPYPAAYSVLTERLDELSPCLELLVPMLQQAWVDYLDNPEPIGDVVIEVTEAYNNYWTLSPELNARAFELFERRRLRLQRPRRHLRQLRPRAHPDVVRRLRRRAREPWHHAAGRLHRRERLHQRVHRRVHRPVSNHQLR